MRLEYNVKKPYTIPLLNVYFFAFSAVSIAALAVLNIALQGYEAVTLLRADPNTTDSYWWSTNRFSVRSAGKCNAIGLAPTSTYRTNSSLFTYKLVSTFSSDGRNIVGASPYIANPLHTCDVDGILLMIDIIKQSFKFDVPILCKGPDLPFSLSLTSSFSLTATDVFHDDIASHYSQNKQLAERIDAPSIERNTNSLQNILAILDAVSADWWTAFKEVWGSNGEFPIFTSTLGLQKCPGGKNETCAPEEMRMVILRCTEHYNNGNYYSYPAMCDVLAPLETDFINVMTVLRDAYLIDFGNIQSWNTLLNIHAFSSRIKPSPVLTRAIQNNTMVEDCTWGLGCMHNETWVDRLLASDPTIAAGIPSTLPAGNTSAVFDFDYLCTKFRLKTPGSLLTSVFIGTWSMYMALVGVFAVVGPILEKRYGNPNAGDSLEAPVSDYELKS